MKSLKPKKLLWTIGSAAALIVIQVQCSSSKNQSGRGVEKQEIKKTSPNNEKNQQMIDSIKMKTKKGKGKPNDKGG